MIIRQAIKQCEEELRWLHEHQGSNGANKMQQPAIVEWWMGEAWKRLKDQPEEDEVSLSAILN
eukprot:c53708_g1_i1 orf=31-219(-)